MGTSDTLLLPALPHNRASDIRRLFDQLSPAKQVLLSGGAVYLVALLVRLAMLFILKPYQDFVPYEVLRIMYSLAETGTFANPFEPLKTGATAHMTPVFPLLLFPIFRVLGVNETAHLMYCVVNLAFCSLSYGLLVWFASVLNLPLSYGVLGGLVGALLPLNILNEAKAAEGFAATVFLVATGLTWQWLRDGQLTLRRGCLFGLLWGFCLLTSPSSILLLAGIFAGAWIVLKDRRTSLAAVAAAVAAGAFLLLLPWGIRNKVELGSFVLLRSNLGLEVQVSNNELASANIDTNFATGAFQANHPNVNRAEAERVRSLGEVEYNSRKMKQAMQYIEANPVRFAELTLQRAVSFWFPWTVRPAQTLLLWVITAGALLGWIPLWARNRSSAVLIAAIWVVFPLLYYFIQAAVRYRMQIQWTIWLTVGAGLAWLVERSILGIRDSRLPTPSATDPALEAGSDHVFQH